MPRVPVPRHVARLVARLITRLVVPLVVDYIARPGAAARRAAHHAARCAARRRLLRLAPLVVDYSASPRLVVDYSVCSDFVLRPRWLYFSHAVRGDYLPCGNTGSTSSAPHAATTSSSGRIASTIHLD
jgi:hypothetical protein